MAHVDNYVKVVVIDHSGERVRIATNEVIPFSSRDPESFARAMHEARELRESMDAASAARARFSVYRKVPNMVGVELIGENRIVQ